MSRPDPKPICPKLLPEHHSRQCMQLAWAVLGAVGVSSVANAADPAVGQTLTSSRVERPMLPGWSTAGDDGAGSMWVTPSNLALDPDPSWVGLFSQQTNATLDLGQSLAFAGNAGPFAAGIHTVDGPTGQSWWTVSSALAIRLDRTVSMGGHLGWHLPEGPDNNFLTGDLSLSWRPAPWFGSSLAVWNVGRWDDTTARAQIVPGIVFRPVDEKLLLSADYRQPTPGMQGESTVDVGDGLLTAAARIQSGKGWVLRFSADQTGRVGAGLELYWGPTGLGGFVEAPTNGSQDVLATVYGRNATGPRQKLLGGPKVASFRLDRSFPYRAAGGFFARETETYLQLVSRLDAAAKDPELQGVLLELDYAPFSFAQVEEIRGRISAMRDAGKRVVVYLNRYPDNRAYFLASAADEILMHPAGDLELIGLSAEMQYFRGTLDILGIEPQVAKRAEYKSAPEGLMRTESSGPAREQMNALLDDLAGNLVKAVAADRGWEPEHVQGLVDAGPYTADEALEKRLVDKLVYPDQIHDRLDELFTDRHDVEEGYGGNPDTVGWMPRTELAIITIDGGIVSGESSGPGFFGGGYTAGADTIVRQLDAVRAEDSIKGVVIRVDSPGGSSFASDEIWRAVERVKEAGKPVVVSMGSVAASGGYYVAAGADSIFASPSTITGSIGVYAGPKLSLAGLYEKVGVGTELYTRGRHAAMWSMSKPMDEQEFAALDRLVGHTYAQFKDRVGTGRGMDAETVESVARGRVWSGLDASECGLVDQLGGFHDAVAEVRERAGIHPNEDVTLLQLESRGGREGEVVGRPLNARTPSGLHIEKLPQWLHLPVPQSLSLPLIPGLAQLEQWHSLGDDRVWMLMPYQLEIQ